MDFIWFCVGLGCGAFFFILDRLFRGRRAWNAGWLKGYDRAKEELRMRVRND